MHRNVTWEVAQTTYYEVESGAPVTAGILVDSGSPDMSVTDEECEAYADATAGMQGLVEVNGQIVLLGVYLSTKRKCIL